jgi:hypothetical protein
LTPEKVAEIRQLKGLLSQRAIAARYGVAQSLIWGILNGQQWRAN